MTLPALDPDWRGDLARREAGSPYILPEGNVQIAFSGGRSSAYMLRHILEANGGLPERAQVIFSNTGLEMPETLDFVYECGVRWGVPIVWLEYRYEGGRHLVERVSHNSASRAGEPFRQLVRARKFLPNQQMRFCTTELKVRTAKRWIMSDLGWDRWTSAIGFRADERHRVGAAERERWTVWRPMIQADVSKRDVAAFWRAQPFDLRLANVNGKTPHGNCVGCFLKSEAYLGRLAIERPEHYAPWEAMEAEAADFGATGGGGFFSKRYSRRELREFMERQGDAFDNLDAIGALCQADGGECV